MYLGMKVLANSTWLIDYELFWNIYRSMTLTSYCHTHVLWKKLLQNNWYHSSFPLETSSIRTNSTRNRPFAILIPIKNVPSAASCICTVPMGHVATSQSFYSPIHPEIGMGSWLRLKSAWKHVIIDLTNMEWMITNIKYMRVSRGRRMWLPITMKLSVLFKMRLSHHGCFFWNTFHIHSLLLNASIA